MDQTWEIDVGSNGGVTLALRPARSDDIPDLLALVHSAYRGEASRVGWTTEADLLDGQRTDPALLAADLTNPALTVLYAVDSNGPLACAAVTDRGGGVGYFGMFAVRPSAQGGRIGSALLAAAEDHARGFGAVRMEMTVLVQRVELIAWYERRGYERTGESSPFPYGDERFGLPRRPDLAFEVLAKQLI
ncbi:MAG: GNAT family N-acetyltransferase [Sporichthyaceae bacterium]